MSGPLLLSNEQLRQAYRSGELTPDDVLEATIAQVSAVDPVLNSIAMLDRVGARAAAEASTRRWSAGTPIGAMDGIPVSIKDSVHSVGMPWRHGCAANADLPDSTWDAPPAARLKEAGAVVFAKTTMPDMGMLAAGVSSLYGITRNPWDPTRSTGGSSAGAGASLAAGIGSGSVGSDIAGSVRLPAGHCGLVALKPTQGRVPHLAPSTMRSAGPMARTTADLIDLYRVITGPDVRDTWSLPPEDASGLHQPMSPSGLRIGVLTDLGYGHPVQPAVLAVVQSAAAELRDGGADIHQVPPLFDADPYPALDRLFQVRARAEWESIAPELRDKVLPTITRWSEPAAGISAVQFSRDTDAVMKSQEQVRVALDVFDYVISPIIPVVGFGAEEVGIDPDHPLAHCGFTAWFNQTAQPASAICFGMHEGMPIGVQLVGRRFDDQAVLRLTGWLEGRRSFSMRWPTEVTVTAGGGAQ